MIVGMIIGMRLHGIQGLMIGMITPRLLVAAWVFPLLALKALGVTNICQKAVWAELLNVIAALGVSMLIANCIHSFVGVSIWVQWTVTTVTFIATLALVSRYLRQDAKALVGGIFSTSTLI